MSPIFNKIHRARASQVALVVKNPLANSGDIRDMGSIPELGRSPGGEHNVCRFPWTEKPGRLQSIGLQRAGHDWSNLTCMHAYSKEEKSRSQTYITKSVPASNKTQIVNYLSPLIHSMYPTSISWRLDYNTLKWKQKQIQVKNLKINSNHL